MSGPKLRSKAPKPTIWREASLMGLTERQRFYAHRAGAQLTVVLRASEDDTIVTANVSAERQARATSFRSPGDTSVRTRNAQIAVAKRWCESEADRIAAGETR